MNLANQTIAITGASAGIGAAIARELAPRVGRLILIARREDRLRDLADSVECPCQVESCDLTERTNVAGLIERLNATRIDGLINNAGFGMSGRFWTQELDRATAMIELNVVALVQLTHGVLPAMVERGRGFVFNVGSIAGFQGRPFMATYGATKSFVNDFSEALAGELQGTGVQCGVICPGSTHTEFFDAAKIPTERAYKVFESAEAVAKLTVRAIEQQRILTISGWRNWVMMQLERFTPGSLRRRVVRHLFAGLSDEHEERSE